MSGYLVGLECSRCAAYYPGDTRARPLRLRRAAARPLRPRGHPEGASRPTTSPGARRTMWRYRELLPVRDDASIVSMGEGFTPMIPVPKAAREVGVGELWVKDEGMNPTGTFKARGASGGGVSLEGAGRDPVRPAHRGERGPRLGRLRRARRLRGAHRAPRRLAGARLEGQPGARRSRVSRSTAPWATCFRIMTDGGQALRLAPRRGRPRALPRRGQEDDGPRGRGAARLGRARRHPVSDRRRRRHHRDVEGLRRAGGARLDRQPAAAARFRQVPGGAVVKAFHEGLDECLGAKHVETIAPGIMVVKPFADFLILRALRARRRWAVGVPDAGDAPLHGRG